MVQSDSAMRERPPEFSGVAVAVQVANFLEDEIVREKWPAGHFIGRRQELTNRFGIAPATLGEAIQLLRSRGIVEAKPGPNGGLFVADRSPFSQLSTHLLRLREDAATSNDCLRVLDALDSAVLRDAIDHANDEDVAAVSWFATRVSEEWGGDNGRAAIWAFHRRIAQITPNELLKSLYLNLVDYIVMELGPDTIGPSSPERLENHLEFARAIEARDHERGDRAVFLHRKQSPERDGSAGE